MGDWNIGSLPYCYSPTASVTGNANNQEYVLLVDCTTQHTKGAYEEIVASLPFATGLILVNMPGSYYNSVFLLDLATGAEGSETVILENFLLKMNVYFSGSAQIPLPFNLPAGTRLSARVQSSRSGDDYVQLALLIFPGNSIYGSVSGLCKTYGAVTASTNGTAVDAGDTADTKGAWVQFSAATDFDIRGLVIAAISTVDGSANYALDVGVGAEGSEVVVVGDYALSKWTATDQVHPPTSLLLPVSIPKGSRLAVRSKCCVNTANLRSINVILYGIC